MYLIWRLFLSESDWIVFFTFLFFVLPKINLCINNYFDQIMIQTIQSLNYMLPIIIKWALKKAHICHYSAELQSGVIVKFCFLLHGINYLT